MFSGNRPFPSYPKPLFESEARCEAVNICMRLIFTRKVLHLALFESKGFWNSEMSHLNLPDCIIMCDGYQIMVELTKAKEFITLHSLLGLLFFEYFIICIAEKTASKYHCLSICIRMLAVTI